MAIIKKPIYFDQQVNAGEEKLLNYLSYNLPDDFVLIPNVELVSTNPRNNQSQYWEYDVIVVAPHAVFNIENKDWRGRIEGDDYHWYLNDQPRRNPLRTNRQKTSILVSKLKEQNAYWGKAWIQNMLTLSYDNVIRPCLSSDDDRLTFNLNARLIDYLTDPSKVDKNEDAIADIQGQIVNYLTGNQQKRRKEEKTQIFDYEIIKILEQQENYTEYLVRRFGASSSQRSAKEYALQVTGLSASELKQREDKIRNQYNALRNLNGKPFVLNVEFHIDEENHLFYEISDFLSEQSLRAEARIKTFTLNEKLQIIKNIMVALKSAHEQNIYHRDINPDNVYLNSGFAYLANFGKSYFIDHDQEGYTVMPTITEHNANAYHPLELTVGDASALSDIYSLGVLVYWLFVEEEPFKSPYDLNRLGGQLPDSLMPTSKNKNLPSWLDEFVRRTIHIDEDKRESHVENLYKFLEEATSQIANSTLTVGVGSMPSTGGVVNKAFEDLKEGDEIDDYTIYQILGKGGYSKVFKVKHKLQGAFYTLKMFNESVNVNSVIDEYKSLEKLHHPNIVKFKWNGRTSGGQFYTLMEFLDGDNLGNFARTEAKLPIHQVYQLAKDILSALVEMQAQQPPILHRDIKPQNIIWDNQERFVLIDFNVATDVEANQDLVGTNPYLAQDLIYDGYKVKWDLSADIFSLGVTLYELLTKQYPWHPKKMPILSQSPKDPKELEPKLSRAFADFILKAIETKADKRFKSASEMFAALSALGDDLLAENEEISGEYSDRYHLYHTQVSIIQPSTGLRATLYNKNTTYLDLKESIAHVLSRFKENLKKYNLNLSQAIQFKLVVDAEVIIHEQFWSGGAKTFTEGNIERVYENLLDLFTRHQDALKVKKISVEGINMVDYLNSLYSQSKYGNYGTRVNFLNNDLDNSTYTHTKLDRELVPAILDGKYKLIIITGNAGDGKTAFVRKVEQNSHIKDIVHFEHRNGARFTINGIPFESNYDGSQDEEGSKNNDVLDKFFSPFEKITNYRNATEGRIIAINEGRLVEFLTTSDKHRDLAYNIDKYFYEEGHVALPEGILIINLNLRSVVAADSSQESLFAKQIKVLTKKELWTKCEGCDFQNKCFIKYNVDSINDSAAGNEIISRLEWLVRTVSLKRELHITMRDLRSFIAFLITRDYSCEDLKEISLQTEEEIVAYWQLYYFNITNPSVHDSGQQDRLIRLLRETDIGEVAIPKLDRELFFSRHHARNFLSFSERSFDLLDEFNSHKQSLVAHEQSEEVIRLVREKHKTYVRHQYFEGLRKHATEDSIENNSKIKKPAFIDRLPYKSIYEFVSSIHDLGNVDQLKNSISTAISLNEGAQNKKLSSQYLVLSSSEIKDDYGKTFRLIPLEDFELIVNNTEHLTRYLEYENDSLVFRHRKYKQISLTISLDLYEMLFFIQKGFSPSLNDMKGRFIELLVFKNLLENLNYNEIVLTKDNQTFYKVEKTAENKILINPLSI